MKPLYFRSAAFLGFCRLSLSSATAQENSLKPGIDASVTAEDEDFDTQLMRATVMISHDKSTGTGFVLTDGNKFVVVTAAHVFDGTPEDETTIVFRRKEAGGVYQKEPAKFVIRKGGKPAWTQHPTEDVAAMWIVPPKNADVPKIPIGLLASDELLRKHRVHPGENLSCLGFPHRNESNEAGFPLLRSGPIASFPLVPTTITKTFYLSSNMFEGDSGGPVYLTRTAGKEDLNLIIGLISGQRFLDEEAKMVYGTTKLRHRLGLAIVVHGAFIKETIDQLP